MVGHRGSAGSVATFRGSVVAIVGSLTLVLISASAGTAGAGTYRIGTSTVRASGSHQMQASSPPVIPLLTDLGSYNTYSVPADVDDEGDVLFNGGLLDYGDTSLTLPSPPAAAPSNTFTPDAMNANGLVIGYTGAAPGVESGSSPAFWDSPDSDFFSIVPVLGATDTCIPSAQLIGIDTAGEAAGGMSECLPSGPTEVGAFDPSEGGELTVSPYYTSIISINANYELGWSTEGSAAVLDRSTADLEPVTLSGLLLPNGDVVTRATATIEEFGGGTSTMQGLDGKTPQVNAVNDAGTLVGAVGQGAALWPEEDAAPELLQSLLPVGSPWKLEVATAISNNGLVAGYGTLNGNFEDFLLNTCNDDPSVTDGDWEFGGCFTQPDSQDYDTQSTSDLDGLEIIPPASDTVDYST